MTKLRERFWPKVFAILLVAASGFAVCFFGISAALEMACYGMTDETSEITWYCAVSGGYAEDIMHYYLLNQGADGLTYLGRQALEEEADYLATNNTNIRYRVMDMDGAAYASNADDFEVEADGDSLYQQVYTVGDICLMGQEMAEESDYFEQSSTVCWLQGNSEVLSASASQLMDLVDVLQTEFPDECDALLGGTQLEELYYTLMGDGIFLWDLEDGDTTSYLCAYLQAIVCEYYSSEYYEDLALAVLNAEGFYEGNAGPLRENAALLEDAESTLTAAASVGETDTDVVISVDGDTESSAAVSDGKTAEDYQAAVAFLDYAAALDTALDDLCSTDCYILEMGIVQNGWVTEDSVSNYVQHLVNWDTNFYGDLLAAGAGALVLLLALIWLMNAAGHAKGQEGIHLCTLARCPQDVMLCLSGGAAGAIGYGALVLWTHSDIPSRFFLLDQGYTLEWNLTLSAVCGILTLAGLSLLPLVLGVTVQLKDRSFLRRTLIARILTLLWRVLRLIVRGVVRLVRAIPATWQSVELYVVFCASALVLAYVNCGGYGRIRTVAGWLLAGLLLLGLWWTVRWQSGWLRVQKGGEVLAGGDLSYQTDTAGLPKDLRRHVEHMNTASQAMEQAVSERIKSDRFRTELITNVSHDLKTPPDQHHQLCGPAEKAGPAGRNRPGVPRRAGPEKPAAENPDGGLGGGQQSLRRCAGGEQGTAGFDSAGPSGHRGVRGSAGAGQVGGAGAGPQGACLCDGGRAAHLAYPGEPAEQLHEVRHARHTGLCGPGEKRRLCGHLREKYLRRPAEHPGQRADGALRPGGREPQRRGQRAGPVHRSEPGKAPGGGLSAGRGRGPVQGVPDLPGGGNTSCGIATPG